MPSCRLICLAETHYKGGNGMTTKHEVDIVFETRQIAINDSPVPVWHLNQGRRREGNMHSSPVHNEEKS